ncbi:MAG TPA: glycosyltransferase, partial [Chroococcales cyanobacterium]
TRDLVIPLGVHPPQPRGEVGKMMHPKGEARRQLGIPEDQPLVLFMSRIDPKKGLNLLIPALESLLVGATDESPIPNFHFVLAGTNPQDPDYENKIREQIKASPLSSCATITGFVTGELKAALLQEADLFVLPSYYENFGIAVAEAMVAGTPVVISDRVYIWEDIQGAEAGWICSCESYSLAQVLREALQDEGERQRRGENARNYALKHYSWDAIALATIDAYQRILNAE